MTTAMAKRPPESLPKGSQLNGGYDALAVSHQQMNAVCRPKKGWARLSTRVPL